MSMMPFGMLAARLTSLAVQFLLSEVIMAFGLPLAQWTLLAAIWHSRAIPTASPPVAVSSTSLAKVSIILLDPLLQPAARLPMDRRSMCLLLTIQGSLF